MHYSPRRHGLFLPVSFVAVIVNQSHWPTSHPSPIFYINHPRSSLVSPFHDSLRFLLFFLLFSHRAISGRVLHFWSHHRNLPSTEENDRITTFKIDPPPIFTAAEPIHLATRHFSVGSGEDERLPPRRTTCITGVWSRSVAVLRSLWQRYHCQA